MPWPAAHCTLQAHSNRWKVLKPWSYLFVKFWFDLKFTLCSSKDLFVCFSLPLWGTWLLTMWKAKHMQDKNQKQARKRGEMENISIPEDFICLCLFVMWSFIYCQAPPHSENMGEDPEHAYTALKLQRFKNGNMVWLLIVWHLVSEPCSAFGSHFQAFPCNWKN